MLLNKATNLSRARSAKLTGFIVPLAVILLVLGILNLGLYTRLSPRPLVALYELPYFDSFDQTSLEEWFVLKGDWQLNNGQLLQQDPAAEEMTITVPLQISEEQPYRLSTRLNSSSNIQNAGVLFNMQHPKLTPKSHIVRFNTGATNVNLVCGYLDNRNNFQPQANVRLNYSPEQIRQAQLTVLVGRDSYAVQVNEQTVVQDIPLQHQGGWLGLSTFSGPVTFDEIAVEAWDNTEPTPPAETISAPEPVDNAPVEIVPVAVADLPVAELPEVGDIVYRGQFEGLLENSDWVPFAGQWAFENGALVQRQLEGYDMGIAHRSVFESYLARVTFQHLSGVGGGVLFNMPQLNSKNGAHLVRFTDDGSGLFWGYFDSDGAFNGQGFVPAPPPGTVPHTLEVLSAAQTYAIYLDGQLVARDIPLASNKGYLGLTSSQSIMAYQSVEIFGLGSGDQPPVGLDLFQDLETISGEWVQEGSTIRQTNPVATDFIIGTGIMAERYTLAVSILLPQEPELSDAGGGLIFHMPTRDSKQGAHMVRLSNTGREIFWGYYDAAEQFTGQGGTELNLEPGIPHDLNLVVRADTYDILVNGNQIAADIPLQQNEGWIGLLSFRGPVTFSNLNLMLGDVE